MIKIDKIGATEKENNILSIIECIVNSDGISSNEIVKATNLSPATVSRDINYFKQLGIVTLKGKEITELGRRPEIYSLNEQYGYIVYYEIRAGRIIGYLADISGNILSKDEIIVKLDITTSELKMDLTGVHEKLISQAGIASEKIMAAGVSIPGVIDESCSNVERIPNIYRFKQTNLFKCIKEALNIPVIINNDSKLATIGEKIECYPNCKDMVFMNFSDYYGIGGGVIINGELHYGKRRAAGEMGDMFFDQKNFDAEYRENMGCLESFAGIQILKDRAMTAMSRGRARVLKAILEESAKPVPDLKDIEQAVVMQDYDVSEIFDEIIKIWASAIINIFALIDPEILVIGGAISSDNQITLNKIKHFVYKGLYYEPDIRLSSIGYNAQVYGGIHMLKKFVYNKLLAKSLME